MEFYHNDNFYSIYKKNKILNEKSIAAQSSLISYPSKTKLFCPTHYIIFIFDFQRLFSELKRMKGIYHHSEFFGFFHSNTFINCTRMGAMWYSTGMQSDHSSCNMLTAHKISIHIIQHFIAINITMVIRRRN